MQQLLFRGFNLKKKKKLSERDDGLALKNATKTVDKQGYVIERKDYSERLFAVTLELNTISTNTRRIYTMHEGVYEKSKEATFATE